jgi:hypothetical protein
MKTIAALTVCRGQTELLKLLLKTHMNNLPGGPINLNAATSEDIT